MQKVTPAFHSYACGIFGILLQMEVEALNSCEGGLTVQVHMGTVAFFPFTQVVTSPSTWKHST